MVITDELAKEAGLTPEQVAALNPKINDYVSEQKKEWDGKANENAENILSGAAKYIQEKTGVKEERQQGEKLGDYLSRISDKAIESKSNEVAQLKKDYEQKIKEFKGDEATKAELEASKKKLDDAQKLLADYDDLKEKASKYESTEQTLSEYKRKAAFGNVKPAFSKDANSYEVDAKWKAFQKNIEEKYTIELVDDDYIAIDKENKYKHIKLSELVEKDESLKPLTSERQVAGTGAKATKITVEGFNVEVTEEAKKSTAERTKVIKEQLTKEGISLTSPEYSKKFAEYNKKIMEAK
ncbi:hypothetical protein [Chryseobacterium proteolyticum]|uniref:hypothetical protein n=1 Tax=Chryseobacterium proteolyticum TaxID=118127 RepID=UPI003983895E